MKIIILFPYALLILFSTCNITKKNTIDEPIIEFEKTPCRGLCPVFILKISNDGLAIYEGKENVNNIGLYRSKLSKEQLNGILEEFNKADFFAFNDSYESFMMDLPTNFISYSINGQRKKIKAYDKIPKSLNHLIKKLDFLVASLNWEKVD